MNSILSLFFGIIFTLLPLGFIGFGSYTVWSQYNMITTYTPVQATVISKTLKKIVSRSSKHGTSTSYKPVIKYSYSINNKAYTNNQVTPIQESSSRTWAKSILNKFKTNKTTTAYYNENKPEESFLIKKYSFFPYIFCLIPIFFLLIGLGFIIGTFKQKENQRSKNPLNLKPISSIDNKWKTSTILCLIFNIWTGLVCGHYFLVASTPFDLSAIIISSIVALIGSILIFVSIYYYLLGKNVKDAVITISSPSIKPGDEFSVHYQQEFKKNLEIGQLKISLIYEITEEYNCGNKRSSKTSIKHEDKKLIKQNIRVMRYDNLKETVQFIIPPQLPPTITEKNIYPKHKWYIKVFLSIYNCPDYKMKFELKIV